MGFGGTPRRLFIYELQSPCGQAEAVPIGTMPAPPRRYEDYLRTSHMLTFDQYVPAQYYQSDIVVLWAQGMIAALCFLDDGVAQQHDGFEQLTRQELAGRFDHFAGMKLSGMAQALPGMDLSGASRSDSLYEVV